jgi:hypothetical protein
MTSVQDAWHWYLATRKSLLRIRRMAEKHWNSLPWAGPLGRDKQFEPLEADDVTREANLGLDHFEDIAVLVLFSVFEAQVRSQILGEVRTEAKSIRHPALRSAATEAQRAIEEGSFFRVLEPYKNPELVGLVEEVNQVRRYRNWVAHGRRTQRPPDVTPQVAFDRLSRFLVAFSQVAVSPPAG